jgi:small-conductance mechanosensitive channel
MDIEKNSKKEKTVSKASAEKKAEKQKVWVGSYITLGVIFIAAYLLLRLQAFEVFGKYRDTLEKISLAAFVTMVILTVIKVAELFIYKKSKTAYRRYNLIRVVRLVGILVIIFVVISFLFANWYAAAVSLGLISLILGFAFQTPISSLIGWFYIIIRNPYRIGDRIQIDDFKGDVVEINYLDTTLWEFGGDYLTNDLPSGRLIRFPNNLIFQSAVFNYSWQKFPFIWNEIPFHVAYESDLDFVEQTIRKITTEELGEESADTIREFKELAQKTAVDQKQVQEYPYINFRINANTWVEVLVTYLVHPKKSGSIRTRLIRKILAALNKEPDRVLFPKSNAR